jgi:hypothetical protein
MYLFCNRLKLVLNMPGECPLKNRPKGDYIMAKHKKIERIREIERRRRRREKRRKERAKEMTAQRTGKA